MLSSTPATSPSNPPSARAEAIVANVNVKDTETGPETPEIPLHGTLVIPEEEMKQTAQTLKPNFSQTGNLSPIINEETASQEGILVNTVVGVNEKAQRQEVPSVSAVAPPGRIPKSVPCHPVSFCAKNAKFNRYESVLTSLEILRRYAEITVRVNHTGTLPRKGKSAKQQQSPPRKVFQFTKEMFMSNNSEAFIQVSHFLLETLNPEDAQVRFRDVWPIYEKKQETAYRREAHAWMKEIVEENPHWFVHVVKSGQLQGLIVNPYGDRFIRFMNVFVNYVLTQVTRFGGFVGDCPIEPMAPSKLSGIFRRQVHILDARIKRLRAIQIETATKLVAKKAATRQELQNFASSYQDLQLQRNQLLTNAIPCVINVLPEFRASSIQVLQCEISDVVRTYLDGVALPQLYDLKITPPLEQKLRELRDIKANELREAMKISLNIFQKRSRLWILLRANVERPRFLDLNNFHDGNGRNMQEIIDGFARYVKRCLKQLKKIDVTEDIQSNYQSCLRSLKTIHQRVFDANKHHWLPGELKSYKKELIFEIRRISMELQGVDWSKFSGLENSSLTESFHLSPTKIIDSSRATGLTPSVSSYLPSVFGVRSHTMDESLGASRVSRRNDSTLSTSRQGGSVQIPNSFNAPAARTQSTSFNSPISRLSCGNRDTVGVGFATRGGHSTSRRGSITAKLRLSLPHNIEEVDEKGSPSVKSIISAAIVHSMTVDQELVETCHLSTQTHSELPVNNHCDVLDCDRTVNVNDFSCAKGPELDETTCSPSSLEEKLGIFDITSSYAKFLDLSTESSLGEIEL